MELVKGAATSGNMAVSSGSMAPHPGQRESVCSQSSSGLSLSLSERTPSEPSQCCSEESSASNALMTYFAAELQEKEQLAVKCGQQEKEVTSLRQQVILLNRQLQVEQSRSLHFQQLVQNKGRQPVFVRGFLG